MFFGGSRREINLRGNDEEQSFEQLEKERIKREEEKKILKHVLIIQSFWRSKKKLLQSQKEFRNQFDSFLSQNKLVNLEIKTIQKMLRYFNFFFDKKTNGDFDRLLIILTIIFKNNYLPDQNQKNLWFTHLTGLFKHVNFFFFLLGLYFIYHFFSKISFIKNFISKQKICSKLTIFQRI